VLDDALAVARRDELANVGAIECTVALMIPRFGLRIDRISNFCWNFAG
jgi:hypothetical protein